MTPAVLARLTDSAPPPCAPATHLFVICAWCTPKAELDRLNAAYPGQVSHTICDECSERLERETA